MKTIDELRQEQKKIAQHTLARKGMKSGIIFKPEDSQKLMK